MRESTRTTLVATVVGLLLLGAVVAFAVALPEGDAESASEETGAPAAPAPLELPDELSDGLVAVDTGDLPAELAAQFGDLDELRAREESVGEGLESLYGVPGEFRLYAAVDGSTLVSVTVLDREPGLFVPETPPIDPGLLGVERASVELVPVGDAVCSVAWGEDVPEGQPVDPTQPPQNTRCQLGVDGRTFEITAPGLPPEEVVALLDEVA